MALPWDKAILSGEMVLKTWILLHSVGAFFFFDRTLISENDKKAVRLSLNSLIMSSVCQNTTIFHLIHTILRLIWKTPTYIWLNSRCFKMYTLSS